MLRRCSVPLDENMITHHASERDLKHKKTISITKAAKVLAILVLLFAISWSPLYTVNTIMYFCPDCVIPETLMKILIVLSHCHSAWNPLLYAGMMKDFKRAIIQSFQCKSSVWNRKRFKNSSVLKNGFQM